MTTTTSRLWFLARCSVTGKSSELRASEGVVRTAGFGVWNAAKVPSILLSSRVIGVEVHYVRSSILNCKTFWVEAQFIRTRVHLSSLGDEIDFRSA